MNRERLINAAIITTGIALIAFSLYSLNVSGTFPPHDLPGYLATIKTLSEEVFPVIPGVHSHGLTNIIISIPGLIGGCITFGRLQHILKA